MGTRICVMLAVLAVAIAGCGGGGGGDDGDQVDPNTSLIGVWQPISATVDGAAVKVSEVMPETDTPATQWVLRFNQNATCAFTAYGPTGNVIETISGTWTSDNGVAPVKIDGETTTITWDDMGNLMTARYTIDGHQVVAKWVRIEPAPTAHPTDLNNMWIAQQVLENGVPKPLADFFEWEAGVTAQGMELQADGDLILTQFTGSTPGASETWSWAASDFVIRINAGGKVLWGYYEYPLLQLSVLDPENGNTIKINWTGA